MYTYDLSVQLIEIYSKNIYMQVYILGMFEKPRIGFREWEKLLYPIHILLFLPILWLIAGI